MTVDKETARAIVDESACCDGRPPLAARIAAALTAAREECAVIAEADAERTERATSGGDSETAARAGWDYCAGKRIAKSIRESGVA